MLEEYEQRRSHFLTPDGERALTFEDHCDEEFSNGLLAVREGNPWGYVNRSKEWVVPPIYWPMPATFNKGLATIDVTGKKGFINTQGDVVVDPVYDALCPLSDGLAVVLVNGPWGFLNAAGTW